MATARSQKTRESMPPPPVEVASGVTFERIFARLEETGREVDEPFLRRVYEFSKQMHAGQSRRSGEPYITHPLHVAWLLADQRFDATCVAVGLLHDVLEDTLTTRDELERQFGAELTELVDGVTKIGQHEYVRRDQVQAETFRKLILASVQDPRAVVVKLADRLHNMLTLEHLEQEPRRRIAQETLEIYAPLAHRLGMSRVQGDLEDLAFYHLYPLQFAELHRDLERRLAGGRATTDAIRGELLRLLEEAGVEAEISYRVKRYYSMHRKLLRLGIDLSQLYDYLAFRVITPEIRDCYAALGIVHQNWRPVPGRFKDYIAMPKPNLYQSLHTTLIGPQGQPFELQIRTHEMDRIAEEGIAAHWSYKEGRVEAVEADPNILWLRQLLDLQQDVEDPRAFLNTLKVDLYPDEVYVFTPKGDVLSFPRGATPLDFAYKVHTELGHQCAGARVNGKLVPLRTELKNGDMVEVITSPGREPSRDWLSFVATSRARSKIRHFLSVKQKTRAVEIGRRLLERELRRLRTGPKRFFDSPELAAYLEQEGLSRPEDLMARVGLGKALPRQVLAQVLGEERVAEADAPPSRLRQAVDKVLPFRSSAIRVKGFDDMLAHLAKCCSPLPGEEIVGYITRGRGVSVHSVHCANVKKLLYNPEREIEVEWAPQDEGVYPVVLLIQTEDEKGILAKLTEVIARHDSNIRQFDAEALETGEGRIRVVIEVRNSKQLEKLRGAIRSLSGVRAVGRRAGTRGEIEETV